jgi:hypothetical protein
MFSAVEVLLLVSRAKPITRFWVPACIVWMLSLALTASALTITYGPVVAPQDPVGGGAPTSAKIIWWTDQATSANTAYVGASPTGPWVLTATDSADGTRHEALVTGLAGETGYYTYVESAGVASSPVAFRTGANLLVGGSFETWHSVSGQAWGTQEPDGWHGWELYPWDPFSSNYANHITIQMDRNTGVPTPLAKDMSHRASMDEGWRTCYGGIYQQVNGLQPGDYIVSGWVAWKFQDSHYLHYTDHRVEILARDGAHQPGQTPSGTTIWQVTAPGENTYWKYVQGVATCTSGTLTVYANLKSDFPDGASYAHFDGMRLMSADQSAIGFSNFQSSYAYNGGTYDVTITYDTSVPATTQVEWGPTASYGSVTAADPSLVTHHVVLISGVQPSTTPYHYRAHAVVPGEVDSYSVDQTFDAPSIVLGNINASVDALSGASCTVTWNSNFATSINKVYYKKSGDASYTVAQCGADPEMTTSHVCILAPLELNTIYQYHVESTSPGASGAISTPDRTFQTPSQAGMSMFYGFSLVGGPILEHGDDVGPGDDWEHLMKYDNPWLTISGLGFDSWANCQPNDPGDGPNVYDWSGIDASIAKAVPGKSRLAYTQIWGSYPNWVTLDTPRFWQKYEEFVEAQVIHINQSFGEVDIVFENEPNISRAPTGWYWADWYIHCLQHFYTAVHRANAVTGIPNKVIAGNLAGHSAGGYAELYQRGLKNYSDIIGTHPYPDNIANGVKVEDLATMHSYMEQYGDGDKKIWVSEGWGSGRSAGFDRSSPLIEPTAQEIENMWYGLAKGYDNLMTPRDHWDPSYLWGINFFCANDNWGAGGWRSRAQTIKDGGGNITGFYVDGYYMTPDIGPYFWNGGMYDFYGNSKDALHLLFPGNGLVFMNPGFELRSEPPRQNAPHFWTAQQEPPPSTIYTLDDQVYHGGSRCLKMTRTSSGISGVSQITAKRSATPGKTYRARVWCKTENVWNVAGRFYIRFCDLNGASVSQQYFATDVTGNTDWTRMEVVATAPVNTSRIEAGCWIVNAGTVRFDDVTVSVADQQEFGVVKGYTLDENQVPVPHSIVCTTTGGHQAVSDANGYYEMTNVPSGTYDLICRKAGYVPFRVKNQTVAAGRVSFAMFCMGAPKPGLGVTAIQANTSSWYFGDAPVSITATVRNYGQYPININDVGLFIESGSDDVTSRFTINPDPYNPKVISAYSSADFHFDVTPRESAKGLRVAVNAYAFGQEDRPNMLANGGVDSSPWNQHWSFTGQQTAGWTADPTVWYSAPNSLKRNFTSSNESFDWANNWSAWGVSAPIVAKPKTNYILGCYHKEQLNTPPSVLLFIQEYYYNGSNHLYNGRRFVGLPRRSVWAHDCTIYLTGSPEDNPADPVYPTNRLLASVGVYTKGGTTNSGTVWFDDLYLKELGDLLADDRADAGASLVVAKPCASIAEAIAQPEGTAVQVTDQVVTAGSESFTDRFYIESSDRACGVGVQLASGQLPARDRLVQVVGVVGSVDGEERLLNAAVTTGAGVPSPSPLGMTGRGLASSGAPGQGLLIKAWGTVTYVAPDSSFFLMDDGSGVPGVAGRNGLKVACEGTVAGISPPAVGQFVIVTGVRGRENNGTVAVLRPRGPEDIVTR